MSEDINDDMARPLLETRGEIVCFALLSGNVERISRLLVKPDYRYLMAPVYANNGIDLGIQCLQQYCVNSISSLVDLYIRESRSRQFIRKEPYPARNMPNESPDGYFPLSDEELDEFKQLLLLRDPNRFQLSFSK